MIKILGLKILRVIIVFVACLMTVLKPDTSTSFFKNLLIFSAGLFYDYVSLAAVAYSLENKHMKQYAYQRKISTLGSFISIVFCVMAIIGLFNVLLLDDSSGKLIIRTTEDLLAWNFEFDFGLFSRTVFLLPIIAFLEMFNKHERAELMVENIN